MSIAVTCNLPDGVILGADSAVTLHGAQTVAGQTIPAVIKVYNEAEKLFELGKLPIAAVTYGIGMLGERTIESYIAEFEVKNDLYTENPGIAEQTVQEVTQQLETFFRQHYEGTVGKTLEKERGKPFAQIPQAAKPRLGLVVCGYSPAEWLSEVWQFEVPATGPDCPVGPVRTQGEFGSNWFGQFAPLTRLIKGFDPQALRQVMDFLNRERGLSPDQETQHSIRGILDTHESRIPYQAMPLQEGIDHVRFLLDVVIGYYRFAVGAPVCGGATRIAVVSRRRGFRRLAGGELAPAPPLSTAPGQHTGA